MSRPAYEPVVTPGRGIYEIWLQARFIPPDDLWDHLPEDEREAWESVAGLLLTSEEAEVLLSGVVGWDEAALDAAEAVHDRAMDKLRLQASQGSTREEG